MTTPAILFGDQIVSATTLNRQSGAVLDRALRGPVTIMRNEEAFALMSRDFVARLLAASEYASATVDLLQAACRRLLERRPLDPTHDFEWISVFDEEDLRRMISEVLTAFTRAQTGERTWEEFDALLHEWEESAWAARSPVLREAVNSAGEQVPLTRPVAPPSEE